MSKAEQSGAKRSKAEQASGIKIFEKLTAKVKDSANMNVDS